MMKIFLLISLLTSILLNGVEIEILISEQKLILKDSENIIGTYRISSSKYGEGFLEGSNQTPLGKHVIKKKIGSEVPFGGRLRWRAFYGEIFPIYDKIEKYVKKDVVQSRILWLDGLEEGVNRGGNVDSFKRYIYIHGTPEEWLLGQKASKGCIRMSNKDVIELYSHVVEGTKVAIFP